MRWYSFSTGMFLAAGLASSAVRSVHLTERSDVLGGKPFASGPYERLAGKVHFAVDPQLPANRIITDIDLAPRNAAGMVEFAADFYVLKPTDPARGNGAALYEVSNRGNKGMLGMFQHAPSSRDPRAEQDFGDRFLLDRGFTLVWLGWQFDVPDQHDALRLYSPVASKDGEPILGPVRSEYIPDSKTTSFSLADRNHIPYLAADPNDSTARLTVRDRCDSARRLIPRTDWNFTEDRGRVEMSKGFEPGKIYEVVYQAQDPVLVGLGPAAIRDFISYLKYGGDNAGINSLGDQRRFLKRAIGFGTSQSGRFLRTFLYYGFNADEKSRPVFDGVWSHVAGGARGSFNHRFAQPSRDGHPHLNCMYPTDIFPFTDLTQRDPESGLSGGILEKAMSAKVTPKVFYTNSSYEYWGRSAGLIHSSLEGTEDVPLAPNTRAFLFAGTQHGPGNFPPGQGSTAHPANANDYRWHMRALLAALNDWIATGKEPPAAAIPMVRRDQLVAAGAVNFPKIPGVKLPQRPQRAWRADYGPEFRTSGIVTQEPPALGNPFAALVPQVDSDGNETSGIRHPMVQVPLGTYTGWNLRTAAIGAEDEIYSMVGSTFFFAATRAERQKKGDPRPSIEERYPNRDEYLKRFEAAARDLARTGYLLESDVAAVVQRGAGYWDAVMGGKTARSPGGGR